MVREEQREEKREKRREVMREGAWSDVHGWHRATRFLTPFFTSFFTPLFTMSFTPFARYTEGSFRRFADMCNTVLLMSTKTGITT